MTNQVATIYLRYRSDTDEFYRGYHPNNLIPMIEVKRRNAAYGGGHTLRLNNNGGYTATIVRNPQTNRYHIGVSRCSETDRFQRRTGREKALQYALLAQEQDKKIVYPEPHGRKEKAALHKVLEQIPMRYLLDDDTIRKIDPYEIP